MSKQHYEELVARIGVSAEDPSTTDPTANWALVEKSTRDGSTWLSTHDTRDAAVSYHTNQEYAEDWSIQEVTDLATGKRYMPIIQAVDWQEMDL